MDMEDCHKMSWESSKENVQPIRSGRKISYLSAALQPSDNDIHHLIEERHKFEEEILLGEGGDNPIDAWDRYLKWTQQHFPLGENNQNYENLLQKYIVKFLKYDKYKNDPRYVNAWLTMSQIRDNSVNTFAYMRSEGIGTTCASFYVAWADEYEKCGKYKSAEAVYELGEKNNAEPAEVLVKMKNGFQMRTARESMKKISEDNSITNDDISTQENILHERKALGMLSGRGNKKIVGSVRVENADLAPSNSKAFQQRSNIRPSQSKLSIYNDDSVPTLGDAGKWSEMPDRNKLAKENVQDPKAWKGSKIKQRVRTTGLAVPQPTASNFTIFKEATPESSMSDEPPPSARKVSSNIEQLLTERKKRPSEEPELHRAIRESYGDKDANIVRMYPVEKVYSAMGEFQPEEILAAMWRKRMRERQNEIQRKREVEEQNKLLEEERLRERERHEKEKERTEEELMRRENQLFQLMKLVNSKLPNLMESDQPDIHKENGEMTVKLGNICSQLHKLKSLNENENVDSNFLNEMENEDFINDHVRVVPLPSDDASTRKEGSTNNSLNQSKLTQPSPTLLTKEAMGEILTMFSKPLNDNASLFVDKEASMTTSDNTQNTFPIFHDNEECEKSAKKFQIFSEENDKSDNSENIPTPDYKNGPKRDCLAGVLVPAIGFELQSETASQDSDYDDSPLDGVYPLPENDPPFLDDVTVARGQNFDNASLPGSVRHEIDNSSLKRNLLEDSIQVNFGSDNKISAESTSYWQGVVHSEAKTPAGNIRSDEVDMMDADDAYQPKKLSPILEASDETEKSVLAKSRLNSESFPPQKSFLHPPTVDRKPFGTLTSVKYEHDIKPEASFAYQGKPAKIQFSVFADDDYDMTTNSNLASHLPMEASVHKIKIEEPATIDDLCAELMSVSVSELLDDPTAHLMPESPSNIFNTDRPQFACLNMSCDKPVSYNDCATDEYDDFIPAGELSMAPPSPPSTGDISSFLPATEYTGRINNASSAGLNIIHDPWDCEIINDILPSESKQFDNVTWNDGVIPPFRMGSTYTIGEDAYSVVKLAGKGGFAKVLVAVDKRNMMHALKIQSPAFPWEVHILEETKRRLRSTQRAYYSDLLMEIEFAIMYKDASCIVCSYLDYGTLLDFTSSCVGSSKRVDHHGVLLQILKLVDALHSVDIIHGDIKPDNFMLRSPPKETSEGVLPDLKLIDFGRAIDMKSFPKSTAFTRNCGTSAFVCSQMKLNQPWNYHTDLYGIAGTLHVTLFSSYMFTIQDKDGSWKISKKLPRWAGGHWKTLFSTLLNFRTPTEEWCPTYSDSPLPSLIETFTNET